MREDAFNEGRLVRYLLGDLSEEEQVEIEDHAFGDPQHLLYLQAVESDLIDEYVRDRLTKSERRQFEDRFLASAERRRKVDFARALASVAPEFRTMDSTVRADLAPRPVKWQTSLAAFLRGLGPAP